MLSVAGGGAGSSAMKTQGLESVLKLVCSPDWLPSHYRGKDGFDFLILNPPPNS